VKGLPQRLDRNIAMLVTPLDRSAGTHTAGDDLIAICEDLELRVVAACCAASGEKVSVCSQ
jgi:hypothetical protein